MSKKLGILGGMGPLATVDLFKKVVMMTNAKCDQEHIHQIIDNNSQIPCTHPKNLVMDFIYGIKEGKDISAGMLYLAMEYLKAQGAAVFILGCTELSYAVDQYGLKGNFVDTLNVVAKRAVEFAFENRAS